jgi:hypothetical protein
LSSGKEALANLKEATELYLEECPPPHGTEIGVSAEELAGLLETAHLLRSPKNARRLLEALLRSYQGDKGEQ